MIGPLALELIELTPCSEEQLHRPARSQNIGKTKQTQMFVTVQGIKQSTSSNRRSGGHGYARMNSPIDSVENFPNFVLLQKYLYSSYV